MSFFKEVLKYINPSLYYSIMPDEELSEEREQIRKKWLSSCDTNLHKTMDLIDCIQLNRMNERFRKEHPDAKDRHKEHGYYLPEDD